MAKATASFVGFVGGLQHAVQEGQELPDGDPIVEAFADMFGKAGHTHAKRATAKRATKTKK